MRARVRGLGSPRLFLRRSTRACTLPRPFPRAECLLRAVFLPGEGACARGHGPASARRDPVWRPGERVRGGRAARAPGHLGVRQGDGPARAGHLLRLPGDVARAGRRRGARAGARVRPRRGDGRGRRLAAAGGAAARLQGVDEPRRQDHGAAARLCARGLDAQLRVRRVRRHAGRRAHVWRAVPPRGVAHARRQGPAGQLPRGRVRHEAGLVHGVVPGWCVRGAAAGAAGGWAGLRPHPPPTRPSRAWQRQPPQSVKQCLADARPATPVAAPVARALFVFATAASAP